MGKRNMKRSEALKVIGKLLMFGLEGMPKEKIESYKNTAFANIILTELELLGMKPPLNENNYDHMDNSDRIAVNNAEVYYTWDKE